MAMLLTKYDGKVSFPVFVEPKIDGVRCLIKNKIAKSRTGKVFQNMDLIISQLDPKFIWDGELYIKDSSFAQVSGLLRQKCALKSKVEKLEFHVFDVKINKLYSERRQIITENIIESKNIKIVSSFIVNSEKEILEFHKLFTSQNYEGTVIKQKDNVYTYGRSDQVQKLKDTFDSEFEIIGFTPDENGLVVWVCENDNIPFSVRPKGTDSERKTFYQNGKDYIGKYLTVQYKEIGSGNVPREPIGLGIRSIL